MYKIKINIYLCKRMQASQKVVDAKSSSNIISLCNFVLRVVKGQSGSFLKYLFRERRTEESVTCIFLVLENEAHASLGQRQPGQSSIPCSNPFNESGEQNLRFSQRFNFILSTSKRNCYK